MVYSRTGLANRALDLVGKDTLLDMDSDTSQVARFVKRNYDPTFQRCLRKAQWSWAIKRLALSPSTTPPVNEFSYAFDLPGDMLKLIRVFPGGIKYKIERDQIICDDSSITIKYVSDETINDPSLIDASFADYFAYELAVVLSYKFSDSVDLRKDLRQVSLAMFNEAAALFSQEDTDDDMIESPWISVRGDGWYSDGTISIEGLE